MFIYQSVISGRRIAIVGLATPVWTALGEVHVLELSDQKPDGSQVSGFDHIEIVSRERNMGRLVADLTDKGAAFIGKIRPHHSTYDATIHRDFKVRIEPEPLLEKIRAEEFR